MESDVPILATSIGPICRKGMNNKGELTIMNACRHMFSFNHIIPQNEQKVVPECGTCFAKLVLTGLDDIMQCSQLKGEMKSVSILII